MCFDKDLDHIKNDERIKIKIEYEEDEETLKMEKYVEKVIEKNPSLCPEKKKDRFRHKSMFRQFNKDKLDYFIKNYESLVSNNTSNKFAKEIICEALDLSESIGSIYESLLSASIFHSEWGGVHYHSLVIDDKRGFYMTAESEISELSEETIRALIRDNLSFEKYFCRPNCCSLKHFKCRIHGKVGMSMIGKCLRESFHDQAKGIRTYNLKKNKCQDKELCSASADERWKKIVGLHGFSHYDNIFRILKEKKLDIKDRILYDHIQKGAKYKNDSSSLYVQEYRAVIKDKVFILTGESESYEISADLVLSILKIDKLEKFKCPLCSNRCRHFTYLSSRLSGRKDIMIHEFCFDHTFVNKVKEKSLIKLLVS